MKTMTVGEFKAKFSDVIDEVKNGEEIAVTFGKKKEIVGYFLPKDNKIRNGIKQERVLGPLKGIGYSMSDNFLETTEEEFQIS